MKDRDERGSVVRQVVDEGRAFQKGVWNCVSSMTLCQEL